MGKIIFFWNPLIRADRVVALFCRNWVPLAGGEGWKVLPCIVLVLVQINLRLEERPGRAIPKPRVAITPASPYAFTVTFVQVVTLPCPQPVHMLWHATTKPTDPNFGG